MDSVKNKLSQHSNPAHEESHGSAQLTDQAGLQGPNTTFGFRNEVAAGEIGKTHGGAHAEEVSTQHGQAEMEKGEHHGEKKGNWFSKMIAAQKERTQKELRAEEAARLRREARIQGGEEDGMLNREF